MIITREKHWTCTRAQGHQGREITNVDVEHALVPLEKLEDPEDDVVDVAEPGRHALPGVVQAARPVNRDLRVAVVELHRRPQRCPRVGPAVVPDAFKQRAVVPVQVVEPPLRCLVGASPLVRLRMSASPVPKAPSRRRSGRRRCARERRGGEARSLLERRTEQGVMTDER